MNRCEPTDNRIHILGRTSKQLPLPLFWTASGAELITDSSELWFEIESDYSSHEVWISVILDGCPIQKMIAPKGLTRLCAFRGLPKTKRTVRIMRETQPARDDEKQCLLLHGFEYDGELYAIPEKKLKFEFVGDSLTSGEGLCGSPLLIGGANTVFGAVGNYAVLTSDYFGADFRLLSQSGWGVNTSCYNDKIRIMPKYYEKICSVLTGEKNEALGAYDDYDFAAWTPNITIVNLGSNDGFAIDRPAWTDPQSGISYRQTSRPCGGPDERSATDFETAAENFLEKIRHHNPNTYILWIYGMCDHTMRPYLEKAVENYRAKTGDERVSFKLLPSTNEMNIGSNGHPGLRQHREAADILIKTIKDILRSGE